MATVEVELDPTGAQFLSTFFPALVKNGTNFPAMGLAYDAASATAEAAFWTFIAARYGSGNVTVNIFWYADTASTNAVVWLVSMGAITADTDTTDVETKALAASTSVTDTHLGTTGQRMHKAVATVTGASLDSLAAGDYVALRVARDSNNGADTMAGDAILAKVLVTYSDT